MNRINVTKEELQEAMYAPPVIEVIDVVVEQTVLDGASSMYNSDNLEDLEGEIW
ncbi:MAG: hypothetical protein WCY79_06535 [Bacteroidales bacterium]